MYTSFRAIMVFHNKCKSQLLFENEINCFLTADHQNLKVWKFLQNSIFEKSKQETQAPKFDSQKFQK